jgi:hypothetical protein
MQNRGRQRTCRGRFIDWYHAWIPLGFDVVNRNLSQNGKQFNRPKAQNIEKLKAYDLLRPNGDPHSISCKRCHAICHHQTFNRIKIGYRSVITDEYPGLDLACGSMWHTEDIVESVCAECGYPEMFLSRYNLLSVSKPVNIGDV